MGEIYRGIRSGLRGTHRDAPPGAGSSTIGNMTFQQLPTGYHHVPRRAGEREETSTDKHGEVSYYNQLQCEEGSPSPTVPSRGKIACNPISRQDTISPTVRKVCTVCNQGRFSVSCGVPVARSLQDPLLRRVRAKYSRREAVP